MKQIATIALLIWRVMWPLANKSRGEKVGTWIGTVALVAYIVASLLGAPVVPLEESAPLPADSVSPVGAPPAELPAAPDAWSPPGDGAPAADVRDPDMAD